MEHWTDSDGSSNGADRTQHPPGGLRQGTRQGTRQGADRSQLTRCRRRPGAVPRLWYKARLLTPQIITKPIRRSAAAMVQSALTHSSDYNEAHKAQCRGYGTKRAYLYNHRLYSISDIQPHAGVRVSTIVTMPLGQTDRRQIDKWISILFSKQTGGEGLPTPPTLP